MARSYPNETQEQMMVVKYCDARGIPVVHVPNEGKRSVVAGANQKRMGLRPGFPDLFIPVPNSRYHGLFIEMKDRYGKPSERQIEWIKKLQELGYCAQCCQGHENALYLIKHYMSM